MPKIILTAHQKGGVGKSTLTFNLALALKNDFKVAIIDLDLQGSLFRSRSGLDIPVFSSEELSNIKKLDFDFVLVDTPPYLNEKLPELSKLANIIIIPTKTGVYDLLAIEDTVNIIKGAKCGKKALIVLNMVKQNTTLLSEMVEAIEDFEIQIAKTYISDLVAFPRSAISSELTDKNARLQMDNLMNEVIEKINN